MTWKHTALRWTARLLGTAIAECIDWDDVDLAEYVDPDAHWGDPVDRLHRLEDDPERAYVWKVESEEAERQWTSILAEEYQREFGRQPKAAHFVVSDLDQLREFDADVARVVDPVGGET